LPEIAAACDLEPKDFGLQLKAAELQLKSEAFATARESLGRAETLAQNDEERETVLTQQIRALTLEEKLGDVAQELAVQTAKGQAAYTQWFLLARYRE